MSSVLIDDCSKLSAKLMPMNANLVREEIALRAARLIAEDGLEYGSAKIKAARDVLGQKRIPADCMPDNETVEAEVREYQALFLADSQPQRLRELRQTALLLMRWLAPYQPYLVGAVLNGTAGDHSNIHLQLFVDSAKDVEIFLLNQNIAFDIHEASRSLNGSAQPESLSFLWRAVPSKPAEGVHLTLYETSHAHAASSGKRREDRLNLAGFERWFKQDQALTTHPLKDS